MKHLHLLLLLGLCLAPLGCAMVNGHMMTKWEIAAERMNLDGVHLGDRQRVALRHYPQAKLMPFGRMDREVYEIPNPKPQISMAVMYFVGDRLEKLELRYFNGPGVRTLSIAGGWEGLRNYMITRFGQPTKVGNMFQQQSEFGDLKPQYAKFSGEWNFPRIHTEIQYLTLDDDKGGMGLVTILNTSVPEVIVQPLVKQVSSPPGPGSKTSPAPASIYPAVTSTPNPGF